MFTKSQSSGYQSPVPGVLFKTLAYGERTLLAEFRLSHGHLLPMHAHHHEQSGYLISGHIVLTIGGVVYEARPGDSWTIPGGVEHQAQIIEDSVAIEVFSPVREDYLPAESRRLGFP
jgi:quercetin dioxygenase-like cupin family protein